MRRPTVHLPAALLALAVLIGSGACSNPHQSSASNPPLQQVATPQPTPLVIPISDGFDYPVGRIGRVSQALDGDGWYNAQDFGPNNHLGEDWNAETGGNTDCGQPVYAAANGTIVFAGEGGTGWGKVIIVRHRLKDGTLVETLYGHVQTFDRTNGDVARRERIGTIGNVNGTYLCHLHFELRLADCPAWGTTGVGYSSNQAGWTDPSAYIDAHRASSRKSPSSSR